MSKKEMIEFYGLKFVLVGSTIEVRDEMGDVIDVLDADQPHELYSFWIAWWLNSRRMIAHTRCSGLRESKAS